MQNFSAFFFYTDFCIKKQQIVESMQWIVFWSFPHYWNVFDPETSWNESDPLSDPAKGQQVSSGS